MIERDRMLTFVMTEHTELFIMTERDLRDQDFLSVLPIPVVGCPSPND